MGRECAASILRVLIEEEMLNFLVEEICGGLLGQNHSFCQMLGNLTFDNDHLDYA